MDKFEELRDISDLLTVNYKEAVSNGVMYQRGFLEGRAFEITTELPEHPEWWDHACNCNECRTC